MYTYNVKFSMYNPIESISGIKIKMFDEFFKTKEIMGTE